MWLVSVGSYMHGAPTTIPPTSCLGNLNTGHNCFIIRSNGTGNVLAMPLHNEQY